MEQGVIKVGKIKFNRKSLKYGSNSLILVAIVVAIAVVINLLVGMGDIKLDLTSDELYSLGNDSKTILKDIKKDVTIYGLFDDGQVPTQYKQLINLINEYKQFGVKVSYVDPDKDTGNITALDKDNTKGIVKGDFVVKSGDKIKKLSAQDLYGQDTEFGRLYQVEPLITGAIKFVTSDVTPVAYFVEGHSENSLTTDLTKVKLALENNNFEAKPLSLITQDKIPDDCKLLVFASPKKDLSESEKIKVDAYFKKNGKAVFLFDFLETGDKFPNFEGVLATFNVGINYDRVKELDDSRHLPGDEYSLIEELENNDINSTFISSGNTGVFLPDSRSLSILKNAKEWLVTKSLIKTSDKAVSSSIINQGATEQGPFDLAIASEITGSSKVLVFGNGAFLTDAALGSQYSSYFAAGASYFLSTVVNWTQDKSDQTTISPKLVSKKELTTTAGQTKVISVLLIGVLPILIMGYGLIVWARRRHL
jgi:hypothetical protein